jgi:hypothetical protein
LVGWFLTTQLFEKELHKNKVRNNQSRGCMLMHSPTTIIERVSDWRQRARELVGVKEPEKYGQNKATRTQTVSTHSCVAAVSRPISLGIVPVSVLVCKYLQENEHTNARKAVFRRTVEEATSNCQSLSESCRPVDFRSTACEETIVSESDSRSVNKKRQRLTRPATPSTTQCPKESFPSADLRSTACKRFVGKKEDKKNQKDNSQVRQRCRPLANFVWDRASELIATDATIQANRTHIAPMVTKSGRTETATTSSCQRFSE